MVPLLRSLLPLPHADLGAVFTLLITGEGLADRRAITDSPQAWGFGNATNTRRCLLNVTAASNSHREAFTGKTHGTKERY